METILQRSKDYTEIVSIRHCPNIGMYELKIDSKWAGAKNPDERQSMFKGTYSKDELSKMAEVFKEYL